MSSLAGELIGEVAEREDNPSFAGIGFNRVVLDLVRQNRSLGAADIPRLQNDVIRSYLKDVVWDSIIDPPDRIAFRLSAQ